MLGCNVVSILIEPGMDVRLSFLDNGIYILKINETNREGNCNFSAYSVYLMVAGGKK